MSFPVNLLRAAGRFVVGSCNGRGPRTAGWFADYLAEKRDTSMQSCILEGGIKGWVKAGGEYVDLMEEYDASKW